MNYAAYALEAYGALKGGAAGKSAANYNAGIYRTEASLGERQGFEEEASVRRSTAAELGRERAAIAQAGGGSGGDVGRMYSQSAVDAELDALRTRYKSQLQGWALRAQAQNIRAGGSAAESSGYLRAASSLLRGYATYAG